MTTAAPRRLPPWVALVVGVGVLALMWALARPDAEVSGAAVPVRSPSAAATAGISDVAPTPRSGLPTVAESALPAEAATTLALIRAGGPYPYEEDDDEAGR